MIRLLKNALLVALLLSHSCIKDDKNKQGDGLSPHTSGKCEAIETTLKGMVIQEWCAYRGYMWYCTNNRCHRKDKIQAE